MSVKIDINADLGEGFGRWKLGDDKAMMSIVSSANVACGFHAGDAVIMTRCVELALENEVALGAHVGLPDLFGFGRVAMDIDPSDMSKLALYQLGALAAIAKVGGARVSHASIHGALSSMQRRDPAYVERTFDMFKAFDPDIIVATGVGSTAERYADKIGLKRVGKIFADRAYGDDGLIASRKLAGSVLHDPAAIKDRLKEFLLDGVVTSMSGKKMPMKANCILIHSDTDGAVKIAETVRNTLEQYGAEITALDSLAIGP